MTKRDPLENFDSVFEFITNFATLNLSFICYCEIKYGREMPIKAKQPDYKNADMTKLVRGSSDLPCHARAHDPNTQNKIFAGWADGI